MQHSLRSYLNNPIHFSLQFFTACVLLGRAYQGLFFDLNLRSFFWDEQLLSPLVTWFTQDSWHHYVTNRSLPTDDLINGLCTSIGLLWLFSAISILFIHKRQAWTKWLLWAAGFALFLLSLLLWKNNYYAPAQLLEQATQIGLPFLLVHVFYYNKKESNPSQSWAFNTPKFRGVVMAIIALTFCSHGLFAIGYYPTSGEWVMWSKRLLFTQDDTTIYTFLKVMGILDFVAVVLLFWRPTRTIGLTYCIIWGFATALARILANFYLEIPLTSLHEWVYQMVFRLGHGGLPLILWLLYKKEKRNET